MCHTIFPLLFLKNRNHLKQLLNTLQGISKKLKQTKIEKTKKGPEPKVCIPLLVFEIPLLIFEVDHIRLPESYELRSHLFSLYRHLFSELCVLSFNFCSGQLKGTFLLKPLELTPW